MRKLSMIILAIVLVFGMSMMVFSEEGVPIAEDSVTTTVNNPLYGEIRGLTDSEVLPILSFNEGSYQNSTVDIFFDVVTNGDMVLALTVNDAFTHTGDENYLVEARGYLYSPNDYNNYLTWVKHKAEEDPIWRSTQTVNLSGTNNIQDMKLNVRTHTSGADVPDIKEGDYTTSFTLTLSAPNAE